MSIDSIRGLTQILVLVCVWGSALSQWCPDAAAITPCKCDLEDSDSTITCSGDKDVDLKKIFETIGAGKHNPVFKKLILTNSAIKALDDNVFGNVAFRAIEITDAYRLGRISRYAFNASIDTLEEFRHNGDSEMTDVHGQELFDLLSSITSMKRIFMDFYKLTTIPDNAFRVINGRQTDLESIHMNFIGGKYGALKNIGAKAFYPLDNLKYLSIANQPITHLGAHTFDFEKRSDQTLEIHLEATQIKGDSFEQGIFQDAKRPLEIDMSNNQMEYVDEKVFRPLFELPMSDLVVVNIQNNALKCDCRMKWLAVGKANFTKNLLEADCPNNDDIFEQPLDKFNNCP